MAAKRKATVASVPVSRVRFVVVDRDGDEVNSFNVENEQVQRQAALNDVAKRNADEEFEYGPYSMRRVEERWQEVKA